MSSNPAPDPSLFFLFLFFCRQVTKKLPQKEKEMLDETIDLGSPM